MIPAKECIVDMGYYEDPQTIPDPKTGLETSILQVPPASAEIRPGLAEVCPWLRKGLLPWPTSQFDFGAPRSGFLVAFPNDRWIQNIQWSLASSS